MPSHSALVVPAIVAMSAIVLTARPAATAAPQAYVRPVGNQYMSRWGQALAASGDSPPHWFLLNAADLSSNRYGWELPQLAKDMAAELAAVLDEGCRGTACTVEAERARASVHPFADDDAETRTFDAPRVRRWTTNDAVPEEHRSIDITGRLGATTVDVACTCVSWTVGMREWNDVAECVATLRDHGKVVLRYAPVTKRGSGKEAIYVPLDAYDQTVTFASGATLSIESGYTYDDRRSAEDDNGALPRKLATSRGTLRWASKP